MVPSPAIAVIARFSAAECESLAQSILHSGLTSINKCKLMNKELVFFTIFSLRVSQNCCRLALRDYKRLQPLTSIKASKETPEKFLLPKKEILLVI